MKKKVTRKTVSKSASRASSRKTEEMSMPIMAEPVVEMPVQSKGMPKWPFAVVLVVIVLGVLYFAKTKLIVATVNGSPVMSWELDSKLRQRYGEQILDTIVAEKLITDEAAKQNVSVSNEEIEEKIKGIESTLQGSMKLEDALKFQGMSLAEFRNQVKTQALVDKLLSKEASVSSAEVEAFIASNAAQMIATTPAERQKEAESTLKNNKLAESFNAWFAALREKAKVQKFL